MYNSFLVYCQVLLQLSEPEHTSGTYLAQGLWVPKTKCTDDDNDDDDDDITV